MILRRLVKIQLIVFLVLALVGTTYTGGKYVGATKLFDPPMSVMAHFAESGGIFSNAQVTYRGVVVGQVGELFLTQQGVDVELKLMDDYEIPADTVALVANKSAVGEQFLDLQPNTDRGPYLEDGSEIALEQTQIPQSTAIVLANIDNLVKSVNPEDLAVVVDELDKAFAGAGPDLQRLIDQGNLLTTAAVENLPQTRRLIDDGVTVLDTQRDVRGSILSFSEDLASFSEQFRASDPDFRGVIDNGRPATAELTDLMERLRPLLPDFLGDLDRLSNIGRVRVPAIEQTLRTLPINVAGGFTVAPGDDTAHFGLATTQEPPVCTTGYESTTRRDPDDTSDTLANLDAACRVPAGSDQAIRGSRNIERPACQTSGPYDTSRRNQPRPPCGNQGGQAAPTGAAATAGGDEAQSAGTPAAYDPLTSTVVGAEGPMLTVGSTGGQASTMGSQSWKALLLGPLGA